MKKLFAAYAARAAWLTPPVFPGDEEKTRRAGVLYALILYLGAALTLSSTFGILFVFTRRLFALSLLLVVLACYGLVLLQVRKGMLTAATWLILIPVFGISNALVVLSGGINSPSTMLFLTGALLAGMLLGLRGAWGYAAASLLAGLVIMILQINQALPPPLFRLSPATCWVILLNNLFCALIPLVINLGDLDTAIKRVRSELTERRRIEDAYRSVVEYSLQGLAVIHADRIVFANPAFARSLGYTPAELLAFNPEQAYDLLYPPERQRTLDQISEISAKGGTFLQIEIRVVRKDGSLCWLEVSGSPSEYNGEPALQMATMDITARKDAEEKLRTSEMRYRNFVEQSIEGIWMLAFDRPIPTDLPAKEQVRLMQELGYVAECNDAVARMYGFENSAAMQGTRLMSLYGGAPAEVNTQSGLKLIHDGYRSPNRETEEYNQAGEKVYFLNTASGVIKDGCLVGLWGTQRDITGIKQAEQALRASEARLRALLEAIPDLIFETDSEGTFTDFVPSQENRTLVPPDDFIGKKISEVMPPNVTIPSMQATTEVLRSGKPQKFEYQLPMDGVPYTYEARMAANGHQHVVTIVRNITERTLAEKERERLIAELEKRNAELERFTYTVSHDLKAPLITIRGFLGFLEKDALSGNLVRMRKDIERIVSATDKMQRLLNDLLELSRIGRVADPAQPVPFEIIVREALELAQGSLAARQVTVEVEPNLPVIQGDRARLVEVVQNLVDNAAKFMGRQEHPRVQVGQRGRDKDGRFILFVRDNGAGIDPAYHERIFGLFNKLDPQSEGTGIGLALVRRIVETHGGRIWVESEGAGRGAAFNFTLPGASPLETD